MRIHEKSCHTLPVTFGAKGMHQPGGKGEAAAPNIESGLVQIQDTSGLSKLKVVGVMKNNAHLPPRTSGSPCSGGIDSYHLHACFDGGSY